MATASRAIWKGVLQIGAQSVPVKLYSAVTDRTVHFRLLHKTDKQPVKQKLVSSGTGDAVEYADVRKAYPLTRGRMVALEKEELETLEPEDSRDVEVSRFVDPHEVVIACPVEQGADACGNHSPPRFLAQDEHA